MTILVLIPALALSPFRLVAQTQDQCLAGTLWEPYEEVCANVRDLRHEFMPPTTQSVSAQQSPRTEEEADGLPVPGGLAVGITYAANQLVALNSGRLHTKMFVHPDGLKADGALPAPLYTTATSRVHHGLEILISYAPTNVAGGRLWLFAWPIADNPWQWFRELSSLTCNITHGVDQGGHAQKLLYYANHTDKLDEGDPPQWKSAMYLWNYCEEAWDLTWEYIYREDKVDCSVAGSGCAWWGPGIETFGEIPYPQIAELGYEDSLLYHDGVWSELRPPEADFRYVRPWAPYQLFHLDQNRGFGAGNFLDENDPPEIAGQDLLETLEDESITIDEGLLVINDPDVDPRFHVSNELTLFDGEHYVHSDLVVIPEANYHGQLTVPVTASDSAADSEIFNLLIEVIGVNDAPAISGQTELSTVERTPITIELGNLVIDDPDTDAAGMTVEVLDGDGYQRDGNTITPEAGLVGELRVMVTVNDGELDSLPTQLLVQVAPDITAPSLTILGEATVTIAAGENYVDAGATASDSLDGDITEQIVIDNSVDISVAGTYSVVYSVADLAGNRVSAARIVIVTPDVTPPEITLIGAASVTLNVGATYTDAGARAVDDVDGDITDRINTDNPVNMMRAGRYIIIYSVSDQADNSVSISRTVIVNAVVQPSKGGGSADIVLLLTLLLTGWRRVNACAMAKQSPRSISAGR